MLGTSPVLCYTSQECLDKNKSLDQVDLRCYLNLLKSKDVCLREMTAEHLVSSAGLMNQEVRYRLTTQVVLPYLSLALEVTPENVPNTDDVFLQSVDNLNIENAPSTDYAFLEPEDVLDVEKNPTDAVNRVDTE